MSLQLITSIEDKYEKELRHGLKLKESLENERIMNARLNASKVNKQKTIEGLGKHIAEIPTWEFFRVLKKYGHDEVHSREFMRYFQKKFSDLSTSKV